jgi:hypothetical protein
MRHPLTWHDDRVLEQHRVALQPAEERDLPSEHDGREIDLDDIEQPLIEALPVTWRG